MTKDEIRDKLEKLIFASLCRHIHKSCKLAENIAGDLIADGVTIQRWIPVTERKPDLVPCGAGTAYSETVNVLTSGRKVMTAVWDGVDFICPMAFWDARGEEITHWTPVLLPLPEPPKGE